MTANEQLIHTFYTAFQNKDYKGMQECYAANATFSDSVFTHLNAGEVKAMWEMFCTSGTKMKIEYAKVHADEKQGSAEWTAYYNFSATGNEVVNRIRANFRFEQGKIVQHTDSFSFYNWASQALGLTGKLLGWTPFLRHKVQARAMHNLAAFIRKNK